MPQKVHFTVSGREFPLTKEKVEYKLATIKAQPIKKVYVKVRRTNFPVIQALAEASGLIRSQVRTQDAVRVLSRLGFDPKEKKKKDQ
jgi:hypothetical protein